MILQGTEVKYFAEDEFDDVHEMFAPLIWEVDKLRDYTGRPIQVLESNPAWFPGTQHKKNSLHYKGRALDICSPSMTLWDFFLAASRFRFTGIGVYPYWNNPGLHVEVAEEFNLPRKYWWRDANMSYRAMNIYDLQEVFTIPAVAGI